MNLAEDLESDPGVRGRLRLILGMRILDSLARDPKAVGAAMPSIRSIASASGAHRNTVATVISDLRGFGLVSCAAGSGCTVRRPRAHDDSSALYCAEPELAGLLTVQLGTPVSATVRPPSGAAVLRSMHLPPQAHGQCIPLAPGGETLSALRRISPGSMAVVVSRSATVRRLLVHSLRSLHRRRVSVMTFADSLPDSHLIRPPLFGPSTVVFHDPDRPVNGHAVVACPLLIAPPKAVDTG